MTVWIRTEESTREPCDLEVVFTRIEASVLTEHQAQQASRGASILYTEYSWGTARVSGGYVVEGEIK
jgi:hypothetical protein